MRKDILKQNNSSQISGTFSVVLRSTLKYALGLASCFTFSACDMIEHHPYDARVEYKDVNTQNIALIEQQTKGQQTLRFVWMGDTQRHLDETEEIIQSINSIKDLDFVIHGGDFTDFGLTREFNWNHELMSKLKVPYVAIIGNHDTIGSGKDAYRAMYGEDNFSFVAARTKFVCLNTNALDYDKGDNVPNFDYIETAFSNDPDADFTVAAMHSRPLGEQLGEADSHRIHANIKQSKGLMFCLNAHGHNFEVNEHFDDGILYYQCGDAADRNYILFELKQGKYTYENINL